LGIRKSAIGKESTIPHWLLTVRNSGLILQLVMKKHMLLSLVGVAALLSGCVVDPYGPVAVNGPGYYGPYGEPYFVYGGMNYYSYGGRYYYVDHGHRVYVHQLPSGGHYYHGHGGSAYAQRNLHTTGYNPYNKTNYSNTNKLNYSNTNYKGQQITTGHGTGNTQFTGQKGSTTLTKGKLDVPAKGSKDKDKDKR